MTTTINASPTNGIVQTADGSGVMKLQSNGVTTNALAWVNFNGTATSGSATIRSSYNVSSVTANGSGDFTVNFTNSLTDGNYSVLGTCSGDNNARARSLSPYGSSTMLTTSARIATGYSNTTLSGGDAISVAIFGN